MTETTHIARPYCHDVTDFCTSPDVIGWLNGRASVFGTEGYGFESRVGLQNSFCFCVVFLQTGWLVLQDTVWPYDRVMLGVGAKTLDSKHLQATQASGVAGSSSGRPSQTY